jgi:uncharacterized membrane protein
MEGESLRAGSSSTEGQFTPERMSALTDGVFAIVLTLLVLELRLPERDESILVLMRDDWRVFVAWLISFVLLARFWLVHHAVTAGLQKCHMKTLALNFVVLSTVSLVPFSADIIGIERVAEPWSTVVFAANVGLLSLTLGLLARHIARESHLRDPELSLTALVRYQLHHLYVLPVAALTSSLMAFAHPLFAVGILLAEFLFFAGTGLRRRLLHAPHRTRVTTPLEGAS